MLLQYIRALVPQDAKLKRYCIWNGTTKIAASTFSTEISCDQGDIFVSGQFDSTNFV